MSAARALQSVVDDPDPTTPPEIDPSPAPPEVPAPPPITVPSPPPPSPIQAAFA